MKTGSGAYGVDASTGKWGDLLEMGIIDPVKVLRLALEHAVSSASLLLLTEATLVEIPEPARPHASPSSADTDLV